jgi:hypothetical protein
MFQQSFFSAMAQLSKQTKALLSLWAGFFILVACGIHGSSTGVTALWWMPEKPYSGYLFWTPPPQPENPDAIEADSRRDWLMARARWIRWDELMIATPLALSQLSHQPKFPVINTNIGIGQNMLINQHAPVWHIATLARPATWGYFLFGAQRGLAWYWWFQVFACFTVLYLLLVILLQGNKGLAAFGAFWYCASAYVVCWSLWPASLTFFIALGCLTAYQLFASEKPAVLISCAILLGLGLAGFVMIVYPPWQVSLGYLFLFVFAGLFIRDKLYLSFKSLYKYRLFALLGAAAVAGLILGAYLKACLPDLKVMAETVYPGRRVSLGGDYSFALFFEGLYNLITIYRTPPALLNQTEAASFYYLFPAVIFGLLMSKRLLKGLGITGWLLLLYLAIVLLFLFIGLPASIATLTLLSYVPPYRADIAIGLASIFLCLQALALTGKMNREGFTIWEKVMPWIASAFVMLLFIAHGRSLTKLTQDFLPMATIVGVSSIAGLLSYCLLSGRKRIFCAVLGGILIWTTAPFNPLSTNLDHLYHSELAEQIRRFNNRSNDHPLWLCYGGVNTGILVTTLGGRSLSGEHWPPQLALWRIFDPSGFSKNVYNRFALVHLEYGEANQSAKFTTAQEDSFNVTLSPRLPALQQMGARYVLALGAAQTTVKDDNLNLLYTSTDGNFSIYEITFP